MPTQGAGPVRSWRRKRLCADRSKWPGMEHARGSRSPLWLLQGGGAVGELGPRRERGIRESRGADLWEAHPGAGRERLWSSESRAATRRSPPRLWSGTLAFPQLAAGTRTRPRPRGAKRRARHAAGSAAARGPGQPLTRKGTQSREGERATGGKTTVQRVGCLRPPRLCLKPPLRLP